MAASRQDIEGWLKRAADKGATHMIVACDTFDYEDYPVFVSANDDVKAEIKRLQAAPMSKVMECYNLSMPIDEQLAEYRAWHP